MDINSSAEPNSRAHYVPKINSQCTKIKDQDFALTSLYWTALRIFRFLELTFGTGVENSLAFVSRAQLKRSIGHGVTATPRAASLHHWSLSPTPVCFQLGFFLVIAPCVEVDRVLDLGLLKHFNIRLMLANRAK